MSTYPKVLESPRSWKEHTAKEKKKCLDEPHCFEDASGALDVVKRLLAEVKDLPLHQMRHKISTLEERAYQQDQTIEQQGRAIAQIQQMLAVPDASPKDDFVEWISSSDAEKYAGMEIAFVPGIGVIESDKTPEGLLRKLSSNEHRKDAVIASVPDGAF